MIQRTATTIENVLLAERTFRIRLHVPEIAAAIRPGQFVMLKLPGTTDPLLGRPFALYDVATLACAAGSEEGSPTGKQGSEAGSPTRKQGSEAGSPTRKQGSSIDVVYLVVGKMTALLADVKPGEPIEVWGPLGNGFLDLGTPEQVTLVAGGIGQTPFLAYTRQLLGEQGYGGDAPLQRTKKVSLYYGVRNGSLAAGVADFQKAGATVHLASDDGSIGHHGYVTQLLERDNPPGPWIGCGPEPMLHALTKLAAAKGVTCHVSLETPMACGFGVCFSCVTKVKTDEGWDYKRVCVEGPVFDAAKLGW